MTIYSRLSSASERLISAYGKNVQLVQKTNSGTAYNPTQTETTTTVKAVVSDVNLSANNNIIQFSNSDFTCKSNHGLRKDLEDKVINMAVKTINERR